MVDERPQAQELLGNIKRDLAGLETLLDAMSHTDLPQGVVVDHQWVSSRAMIPTSLCQVLAIATCAPVTLSPNYSRTRSAG